MTGVGSGYLHGYVEVPDLPFGFLGVSNPFFPMSFLLQLSNPKFGLNAPQYHKMYMNKEL